MTPSAFLAMPSGQVQLRQPSSGSPHIAESSAPGAAPASSASGLCGVVAFAVGMAAAVSTTSRSQKVRGARRPIATYAMSADEDALFQAVSRGAGDRITKACLNLTDVPKDAMKLLDGDWEVAWDSNYNGGRHKTLMKFVCPELPSVMVEFYQSYIRITDKEYKWIQGFIVDGYERVDGAMVITGKRTKNKKFGIEMETVQVIPSDHAEAESREMLQAIGLGKFLKPQKIKGDGEIVIDMLHVSKEASVQKDEAGTLYACKVLKEGSRGIPFKVS